MTVSGNLTRTTDGEIAQLDWAMLEGIGFQSVSTSSPWYDEIRTFEGVPAKALMEFLGVEAQEAVAIALNEYQANIPTRDFLDKDVLLALMIDGEPLSIRDKGPLFIIYPFDQNESLRNETYFARSVWQLKELRFLGRPVDPEKTESFLAISWTYMLAGLIALAIIGVILKHLIRQPGDR